jgi:hypothetical protein
VRFGPWLSFERAAELAPSHPGLLQARGEALLPLPRGKSAMVLYDGTAAGESLQEYLRGDGARSLRRAAERGAQFIRFGASAEPELELARLLANFEERFGALPPANLVGDPSQGVSDDSADN